MIRRSLRHALSFQTLFTAFLGIAIWSLFRDWWTGFLLTLLLYTHEMGHILGALVRRIRIQQGPTFIPGLGAFVMVDEGENHIDDLVLYLSGPIVGAVGALLFYWIGLSVGDPHITWAGHWGVWINLINLLPLLPFDGGRIIRLTGRIGLITGLVAAVLIALLTNLVSGGFIGLGLSATWRAIKQARHETPLPLVQRLVVVSVYLLTGALILLALRLVPEVRTPPRTSIPELQPLSWGALVYCALYLIGLALTPWSKDLRPWQRYGMLLLFGWPRLLLRPWRLLLVGRIIAATFGRNQWDRLASQLQHLAQREEPGTGEAAAWVYDALSRTKDHPTADLWWGELLPTLMAAGPTVVAEAHRTLVQVSQAQAAADLRHIIRAQNWSPDTLDSALAGAIASDLQQSGRLADALPFARRSLSTDDAQALVQFGKLCREAGEFVEAEWAYRMALAEKRSPTLLMGLGEVLARQGRQEAALKLGYEALHKRITDVWGKEEPTEEEINATLQSWQEESHPLGEP